MEKVGLDENLVKRSKMYRENTNGRLQHKLKINTSKHRDLVEATSEDNELMPTTMLKTSKKKQPDSEKD